MPYSEIKDKNHTIINKDEKYLTLYKNQQTWNSRKSLYSNKWHIPTPPKKTVLKGKR
jgi:hypothetical protein